MADESARDAMRCSVTQGAVRCGSANEHQLHLLHVLRVARQHWLGDRRYSRLNTVEISEHSKCRIVKAITTSAPRGVSAVVKGLPYLPTRAV